MKYHSKCFTCGDFTLNCKEWFNMTNHVTRLKNPNEGPLPGGDLYCSLCVAEKSAPSYINEVWVELVNRGHENEINKCTACTIKAQIPMHLQLEQVLLPRVNGDRWDIIPYPTDTLPLVYGYVDISGWKLWDPMNPYTLPIAVGAKKATHHSIQLKPGQRRCMCNNCEKLTVLPATPATTDFVTLTV